MLVPKLIKAEIDSHLLTSKKRIVQFLCEGERGYLSRMGKGSFQRQQTRKCLNVLYSVATTSRSPNGLPSVL